MNKLPRFAPFLACLALASQAQAQQINEAHFHKGNYAADGDYILNGGLLKDLPAAIEVPVHYDTAEFDASRLTAVPEAGIHPRIILSPEDIDRFWSITPKEPHADTRRKSNRRCMVLRS